MICSTLPVQLVVGRGSEDRNFADLDQHCIEINS